MRYDLLMQNTGSKREYLITGLRDTGGSASCYVFSGITFPADMEPGEYECVLFAVNRHDVEYRFSDDLLETEIVTKDGTVKVRQLRGELFLLKYGDIESPYTASPKNNEYHYYNG